MRDAMGRQPTGMPSTSKGGSSPPPTADDAENETRMRLKALLGQGVGKFTHTCDFGDDWSIRSGRRSRRQMSMRVSFSAVLPAALLVRPRTAAAFGATMECLDVLTKPPHPEYAEREEWLGEIDPESFDLETVNQDLGRAFRKR